MEDRSHPLAMFLPSWVLPRVSFRGMNGYDAAYYGYPWSDAIAADMATMFEKAGYLDRPTGLRLRQEVYEPGGSRDVNTSVEKFLGRPFSSRAFLQARRNSEMIAPGFSQSS